MFLVHATAHTRNTHANIRERFNNGPTHTVRGRVKKEKPAGLGRKGEAMIEYFLRFEAWRERESACVIFYYVLEKRKQGCQHS